MPVDNQKVKEFEDEYKRVLFEQVGKVCSAQTKLISLIKQEGEYVELEDNLNNVGITLNNKIIELQHQFANAGISIYSEKIEDYGIFKLNHVGTSFLGKAIIFDLINYASVATQKLGDFTEEMEKLTNKRNEKIKSLKQTTPIKRFFAKIKRFFIPVKQEDFSYTKAETDELNAHLLQFKEIDNQIYGYNLRDNVIDSIVRHIRKEEYLALAVPGLLEESINPYLQKLGLEDLIPQLQQALIEEYEKDLPDAEIYQIKQEDMYLYVPDFNRPEINMGEVDLEELNIIPEQYHKLCKDDEMELE